MGYGKLYTEVFGSHTEDEWQAKVRKYMWRCFYCGSPMSAWRDQKGRVFEIRARNADRPWESSGKVMAFSEANRVSAEHILTKDHLVPLFHNNVRDDGISNIVPACWRCNRMKGQKTAIQFRNERPGLIQQWLDSLPEDDWRVHEWDGMPTDEQIEAAIDRRFAQDSLADGEKSTGVFAVSAFASELGVDLGFEAAVDSDLEVEIEVKAPNIEMGGDFAFASKPSRAERIQEAYLLRKVYAERERLSYYWRSAK